eukprot:59231_1
MADDSKVESSVTAKRNTNQTGPTDEKKDDGTAMVGTDANVIVEVAPIFNNSTVIKFKWNKEMKELKDCDTKHMLYLLWLALLKVRDRTVERNKHFKSINREDRIQKYQDNPKIITMFIEWHNKDPEKNKFDGALLEKKQKKDFTNDILTKVGGTKMGWSTKIYHYLTKEVKIDETWHTLEVPCNGHTKLASDGKVLEECSIEDMKKLLTEYAFDKCKKLFTDKNKEWPLENHKEGILKYFEDNKIDGKAFRAQPKKVLNPKILDCIDKGNKKLNGPLTKLYTFIETADLNALKI